MTSEFVFSNHTSILGSTLLSNCLLNSSFWVGRDISNLTSLNSPFPSFPASTQAIKQVLKALATKCNLCFSTPLHFHYFHLYWSQSSTARTIATAPQQFLLQLISTFSVIHLQHKSHGDPNKWYHVSAKCRTQQLLSITCYINGPLVTSPTLPSIIFCPCYPFCRYTGCGRPCGCSSHILLALTLPMHIDLYGFQLQLLAILPGFWTLLGPL